ncbi:MAG: efflux RND transporter permease subunit [Lachnospiraceae bacterium]|nr:efflux RND transporter permease subunit [Lachnospiraceae bacterium]
MSKLSVKKPFTVLVMIVIMIVLGVVSIIRMQMDLLPQISLPYVLVITTYPGKSPEAVEETISKPLEQALGTISGVKNVYSISNENYGLVELEFTSGTDLDAIMVKVYTQIDTVRAGWPDDVGIPQIMELSTDMLANQYLAVSYEGMDIDELSRFTEETVIPAFERLDGVASVSPSGLIEKTIQISLDQDKVDILNAKIYEYAEEQLDDALEDIMENQDDLDEARDQLIDSQNDLNQSQYDLNASLQELTDAYADLIQSQYDLVDSIEEIDDARRELDEKKVELEGTKNDLYNALAGAESALSQRDSLQSQLGVAQSNLATLQTTLAGMDPSDPDYATVQGQIAAAQAMIAGLQSGIDLINSNLSKFGINSWTDLDRAKMEAASQFGAASAQLSIAQQQLEAAREQAEGGQDQINDAYEQIMDGFEQIADGQDQINDGQQQINEGWESYYDAVDQFNDGLAQYEIQRQEALKKANSSELLTLQTLSQLIYAQNFDMPAGYIDDKDDNSWLLKIGNEFDSIEEMENTPLVVIDGVGTVLLKDVANVTVVDNSDVTFTRLGVNDGVILSVFKSSESGANDVANTCINELNRLEEKYPGLDITVIMDQGAYIEMILSVVVTNMLIGAGLAILILALFLKDFLPTLVVAISIPLSVLTALVAMYFSGVSLNMMSLFGMSLGIGMLVDNSIVVMENIYRLRGRGIEAPRASVQGARQVFGAVTASTLTTICVFFPMVYTDGLIRELMMPLALTIIYTLLSSLLISMTVVPAACSTLLKKTKPKPHKLFDRVMELYEKALSFCLKVKILPLGLAVGLLVFSIVIALQSGIVMIPNASSPQIQGSVTLDENLTREESYEKMGTLIERLGQIEGIKSVCVMSGNSDMALLVGATSDGYSNYSLMILCENEEAGAAEIEKITDSMYAVADELGLGETFSITSGMDAMDQMLGSGLSLSIFGDDIDELNRISGDIMDIIATVPGYTDISNGNEDAKQILHMYIDRDAAINDGLTVAQIYQAIYGELTTSSVVTSVNLAGEKLDVEIITGLEPLDAQNIMDYTFTIDDEDEDGNAITRDEPLSEYASIVTENGQRSINRQNSSYYIDVTAGVEEGYNNALLSRELLPKLEQYELPSGYTLDIGGETETTTQMISQMALVLALGLVLVYLIMVAQFQSLLSPFIILFTIPLAFTGGFLGLRFMKEPISMMCLMGLMVLMGTVVNNGIVYVDYTNQLRKGGLSRHEALIAAGKTRMRPILMTAMTTILAEASLCIGDSLSSQLGRGMGIVIIGGLAYATLMTLFIVPVIYDILFRKQPLDIDTGSESLDDIPDDAAEFLKEKKEREQIATQERASDGSEDGDSDESGSDT